MSDTHSGPTDAARPTRDLPTRDKIVEVGEALFAARGYAGTGLQLVAETVGIRKSSFFHHFATKRELYEEVLTTALERIEERVSPALETPGPCDERLGRWLDALIDCLAEHPPVARLLLRSLVEDPLELGFDENAPTPSEAAVQRLVAGFQRLLARGIEAGVFRPMALGHATQTVIGATVYHFSSAEWADAVGAGPIFSSEAVAARKREVRNVVLRGFAAGAPLPVAEPDCR